MKRTEQVKNVCALWHGGHCMALYQFASSGIFVPENALRYLKELQECKETEYKLYPSNLSSKDTKTLTAAQNYFMVEAQKAGIFIQWIQHPIYGYKYPVTNSKIPTKLKLLV